MKIERTNYPRTLFFSEVPGFLGGFKVLVNYTGDQDPEKAVALDTHIIPAIAALPDVLEALAELVELEVCRNMDKARAALAKAGITI